VKKSLTLFSISEDPDYEKEFRNLLIFDVCTLTQNLLDEKDVNKCREGMNLKIL
jgi:hypothetical protein